MGDIKIVQYSKEIAQQVADMWNNSRDGWGGGDAVRTAEEVHRSESNSENANLYLAMEEDLVVGYCSLSEYKFDEDTMYIPLLNVRPSHHGKKIGKKLLLAALERVIELGWPRLDLFTWPGNTKAVPLYKKCGFFWEEMDESTHLMNFIPTVISTEAIKDYFQHIDWYNDSTRFIDVKPDGEKENKFEYYEYSWEKESTKLRVQFERRGRGIRLIETDDYLISATVENINLVFGRQYQVEYKVTNKTGKPLKIEIEGTKNKNIDNTFKTFQEVATEAIIQNNFSVSEVKEEQSNFKTHPTVSAKIKINGKEALFQVGIIPEFPAKLAFKGSKELCYLDKMGEFYLDIENKFDEEAEFTFNLPASDFLEFKEKNIKVMLEANGRTSVSLHYTLKNFGFYYPKLQIAVKLKSGEIVEFTKEVGFAFKGLNAKFYGETEKYWEMHNDKYKIKIEKEDYWQIPTRQVDDDSVTAHMPPRVGKPFFDEFSKKGPVDFNFYCKDGSTVLEYIFESDKKKGIKIRTIHELYTNGLLATKYEVMNKGYHSEEEISLALPIMHGMERAVLPIKDEIIELNDSVGASLEYWDSKDLAENWIFAKGKTIPRGLCWSKEYEPELKGWHLMLTTNLGKIADNSSVITKPVYISVGAFSTWQEFRAFALEEEIITKPVTNDATSLIVNGGNPFVKDTFPISVVENRSTVIDGEITIESGDESKSQRISAKEKLKVVDFELTPSKTIDCVKAKINLTSVELNKERVIFRIGNGNVENTVIEEQGHKVYVSDNGLVKVKVAPTFAPAIYSMEYQDKEWLDSSFPQVGPKSWWSPWQGGLSSTPESLLLRSTLKEEISANFVEINDEFNNKWSGMKITVKVSGHEKFKGLTYHQYYLMLPNAPVLCQLVEIEQGTGTYLEGEWMNSYFFKIDEDLNSCFLKYKNSVGEWVKNKAGATAFDGSPSSTVSIESGNQKTKIHLVSDIRQKNLMTSHNKEVIFLMEFTKFSFRNGDNIKLQPNFFVLTDERIEELALKDLLNLRF